jgi:hypothetical protein
LISDLAKNNQRKRLPKSSTIKNRIQLNPRGENGVDKEPFKIIEKDVPPISDSSRVKEEGI